jgi:hypothetical protein
LVRDPRICGHVGEYSRTTKIIRICGDEEKSAFKGKNKPQCWRFDRRIADGVLKNGAKRYGIERGAAIGEIVAIDRGNHHVGKTELGDGIGQAAWLGVIQRERQPSLDVAEGAGARAHISHDHHGRVPRLPAFADVRAALRRTRCGGRGRARSGGFQRKLSSPAP